MHLKLHATRTPRVFAYTAVTTHYFATRLLVKGGLTFSVSTFAPNTVEDSRKATAKAAAVHTWLDLFMYNTGLFTVLELC